ncbi:unnamed protein product [Amaranthus hypochondriacus]
MEIKSEANSGLITRDFLGGGCFGVESKELDLDLHVPTGWEKRLDLKSGKVFLQRCNPAYTANEQRNAANKMSPKHHDLNTTFLQSSSTNSIKQSTTTTFGLLEHPSLDLKLVSNNNSPASYTSVCTLDKVKSALDRAERASPTTSSSSSSSKKRLLMMSTPSPSNNSSSVSDERDPLTNQNAGLLVAAACPGCLLYVLISKNDPKCPKCSSLVNLPVLSKKPKIDLNISI